MLSSPQLYWNRIVHPTDFSAANDGAFAHALKLATREQSHLTIPHIEPDDQDRYWGESSKVREMLARWRSLPTAPPLGPSKNFPKVKPYAREHWKWEATVDYCDLERQILRAAKQSVADIIVMPSAGHHGFPNALRASLNESFAKHIVPGWLCPPLQGRLRSFRRLSGG